MRSMYFKRAKIFLHQDSSGGELRYLAPVGGPVQVPNWVCKTLGYKLGIKDGSIVDVTPPKVIAPIEPDEEAPTAAFPGSAQEAAADDPAVPDDTTDEEEAKEEEPEAEEAPKVKAPKPSRAGKGSIR